MSIDRRSFLRMGAAAGAGLMVPWRFVATRAAGAPPIKTPNLTRWVDAVPIPPVLTGPAHTITMAEHSTHSFHSQLGSTRTWGYGGAAYLGPTFEVQKGSPVTVTWLNNLPDGGHLLPVDFTLHWSNPTGIPHDAGPATPFPVPAVPHLHGGFTVPQADGHPEAWWTATGERGAHYVTNQYVYGNDQRATHLWYHDHALGITRLNVYAGLAGLYFIRDEHDTGVEGEGLNLPKGPYEVPLVIQDKTFNRDGSMFYPSVGVSQVHPVWTPEFFGDTPVVNGKAYPFHTVEPRRYRFRIVNGSNARFYNLKLATLTKAQVPFHQIGNEGGLLPAPVPLTKLLIAPGERADVIIDFAGLGGETVALKNDARAPFPGGKGGQVNQVMQFNVQNATVTDTTTPAAQLALPSLTPLPNPSRTRALDLVEVLDPAGAPLVALVENLEWFQPVITKPEVSEVEDWLLVNTTGDAHPIHLHLVHFEVIDRRPFNVAAYAPGGPIAYTRPPVPAAANERGLKDTVIAMPGEVTRIRARFDLPEYAPIALPDGISDPQYVWHCHILEHEDNEMMRPFEVTPA